MRLITLILFIVVLNACSQVNILNKSDKKDISTQKQEPKQNQDLKKAPTAIDPEMDMVEVDKLEPPVINSAQLTPIQKHCDEIDGSFKKYRWGVSDCHNTAWKHVRNSVDKRPLFWTVFGDEYNSKKVPHNTTMILCGVHGDEITPIKFCFDIINHFKNSDFNFKDHLLVVAPIVNPDSYFKRRPTRTNARGIDINRNFPTKDWWTKARKLWKTWYRQDKRRNPGHKPVSEPEVLFQVNLIKRYRPSKIISVHAPLTMIDYDGPGKSKGKDIANKNKSANQLLIQMSQKASGYRVKNYRVFPGSLGNYAGNERNIPTYTLELPSSDYTKSKQYWKLFRESIDHAVKYDFRRISYNDNPAIKHSAN